VVFIKPAIFAGFMKAIRDCFGKRLKRGVRPDPAVIQHPIKDKENEMNADNPIRGAFSDQDLIAILLDMLYTAGCFLENKAGYVHVATAETQREEKVEAIQAALAVFKSAWVKLGDEKSVDPTSCKRAGLLALARFLNSLSVGTSPAINLSEPGKPNTWRRRINDLEDWLFGDTTDIRLEPEQTRVGE
jgi:hypothetical protein